MATEPLTFRGCRVANTVEQLSAFRELNEHASGLLEGVTDQSSYHATLRELRLRFDPHGISLDHLPALYSANAVESLIEHCRQSARLYQSVGLESGLQPLMQMEAQ